MFLNYLKNLILNRKIKKSLTNVKANNFSGSIKTVGLFIDESCFFYKEKLIDEIVKNGIDINNIKVILYKESFEKKEVFTYPTFGLKDFDFNARINLKEINAFINEDFDLLINYYDIEKPVLLLLTNNSSAKFKVGFSSIDKRLNHFMIAVNAQDYSVFTQELFRYLKILNKI
ncbi:DUF6913 domain-containing protein [Flavobacterium sp. N3904]|uniref:DUF6913 domain-containing protein n=1 Tax=Flavobacterium sp. N3904 TaxID=2986835 RepID=UPI0022251745|nr:hypothetical protein [Flavobacterium sp. N3904]